MARRHGARFVAASVSAGVLALVLACGSSLPAPPAKPQLESDFVTVPYPPPPARVETVPERPRSGAVWVDGGWFYEGSRWRWHAGGWYDAPGLFFSKWVTERAPDGRLLFANATWRDASGAKVQTPKVLAEAVRSNLVDAGPDAAPPKTEFEATPTTKASALEALEAGTLDGGAVGDAGPPKRPTASADAGDLEGESAP